MLYYTCAKTHIGIALKSKFVGVLLHLQAKQRSTYFWSCDLSLKNKYNQVKCICNLRMDYKRQTTQHFFSIF